MGAHGKVNHGGAVSNWEAGRNVPSQEQYEKLRDAILCTGNVKSMPDYQDLVRPFFADKTKEFTDIWTFPNIRPGQSDGVLQAYKSQEVAKTKEVGQEGINYWTSKIEEFSKLSREQAVRMLIKAHKIEQKIETIKKAIEKAITEKL